MDWLKWFVLGRFCYCVNNKDEGVCKAYLAGVHVASWRLQP